MKLKAGALFLVLIISLIIAVICSSLIMLSYFNRIQVYNNNLYQKLKNNVDSGINILSAAIDTSFAQEGLFVDLYGKGTDSVYMKRNSWGVFEYISAKAQEKGYEIKAIYLMGNDPQKKEGNYAIYVSNQGRSISVCGNTKIVGDVYLPDAGIRREYSPVPFSGTDLFKGKQFKSEYQLPKINTSHINRILEWSKASSKNMEKITSEDSLFNSFDNELIILNLGKKSQIPFRFIKGNVIIIGDSVINVQSSQIIEDIIVVARGINFIQGFMGMGQFYAFDSLTVQSNVKLQYPTVLGIIKQDYRVQKPFLKIMENSSVKGLIFSNHQVRDLMGTYIKVGKNAKVEGEVYSEGFLEINGAVYGSVATNKFMLNTSSSIYENYLMDAEIDFSKRHNQYVASHLLKTDNPKKIAKCLY